MFGKYPMRAVKALTSAKWKAHFSQYGEDIIIHKQFPKGKIGRYIDLGAFHPFHFSNTAFLWLRGWSGINVDANPNSIKLFEKVRPDDINMFGAVVSSEIASKQSTIAIHLPSDDINTSGTCDPEIAEQLDYGKKVEVPAITVADIIKANGDHEVDFLNIDLEGFDAIAVSEIDFNAFRPKVICIEDYSKDVHELMESKITQKLTSVGYRLIARVGPSAIFQCD